MAQLERQISSFRRHIFDLLAELKANSKDGKAQSDIERIANLTRIAMRDAPTVIISEVEDVLKPHIKTLSEGLTNPIIIDNFIKTDFAARKSADGSPPPELAVSMITHTRNYLTRLNVDDRAEKVDTILSLYVICREVSQLTS